MILLVLIYLMSSLVIVLSHELLHFFMAKIKEKHYSSQDNQKLNRFFEKYTHQKSLSVPFVVSINSKGQVETHVGTVSDHDAEKARMTIQQKSDLKKFLDKMILFSKN